MKTLGVFAIAAASAALFVTLGSAAAHATAAPSFDFSSTSLDPTISLAPDNVFTFSDIAGSVSAGTLVGPATLTGTGTSADYTLTLDEGLSTYTSITGAITDVVNDNGKFGFEVLNGNSTSGGVGTVTYEPGNPGGGLVATYSAPVPEVSSSIALAAMLALGGIVLVASKRRSSSTIA